MSRLPGRPRNELLQAERRMQILDAACRVFSGAGYDAGETQRIADEAGVSKGTVFRYFASKQELFFAAVRHGLDRLKLWLEEHVPASMPPREQIAAVIRAYLTFFDANPDVVELIIMEKSQFKGRPSAYFEHLDPQFEDRWDQLVLYLMEIGHFRSMPVAEFKMLVGDLVFGTMFSNYLSGRQIDPDLQATQIVALMNDGLRCRPGATP